MKILIYDCEIIKCIGENSIYQYCDGWDDFSNMGISVIGTWRNFGCFNPLGKYEAFINHKSEIPWRSERLDLLAKKADLIIGFNSYSFDDNLTAANGYLHLKSNCDLLAEIRVATGQPPYYIYGLTRAGYSLDKLALANLNKGKSGTGAAAPILWQKGDHKKVIDYCLNDIKLTKQIWELFERGDLRDPVSKKLINQDRFDYQNFRQWIKKAYDRSSPSLPPKNDPFWDIPF